MIGEEKNLKGEIECIYNYQNGILREVKKFDKTRREASYISYDEGLLAYSCVNHFTEQGCIRIIKDYYKGEPSKKTIIFLDTDGSHIMSETYDKEDKLIHVFDRGVRKVFLDDKGRTEKIVRAKKDKTFISKTFEYDEFNREIVVRKFAEDGNIKKTIVTEYKNDNLAKRKKAYNSEGNLYEIKDFTIEKGKIAKEIIFAGITNSLCKENLSSEGNHQYISLDGKRILTEDEIKKVPEVTRLLNMLKYDINGNKIEVPVSIWSFTDYIQYEYDSKGREIYESKDRYWAEFSTNSLTNIEFRRNVYNDKDLLIEHEWSLTESEWDSGNHQYYDYEFDEQERVIKKICRNDKNQIKTTIYKYNRDGSYTENENADTPYKNELKKYDKTGNLIYRKSIYRDGEIAVEEFTIKYY